MCTIEKKIISAIGKKRTVTLSSRDRVEYDADIDADKVWLHSTVIAVVSPDKVTAFSGGGRANTTKSRLNAILWEYCATGIYQNDFTWYVNGRNDAMFSGKAPVYFEDGMEFPRKVKHWDGDAWIVTDPQ